MRISLISRWRRFPVCLAAAVWMCWQFEAGCSAQQPTKRPYNRGIGNGDSAQWGRSPHRNNAADKTRLPDIWNVETGQNIKWSAPLGFATYGTPVVANGKVYVGTNNGAGYLKRFPKRDDVSVLLCFRESDGEFLWQHTSEKLPRRVHDWPQQGIHSSPVVEGDRLWYVTSRGEVVCLDAEGFQDDEDDGLKATAAKDARLPADEADIVWSFDMMDKLGVRQHNRTTCSPTIWGDVLFVCTSNGVDDSHINVPAPNAPSFLALNKHTGEVLWTDESPGKNILHGQWSSPAVGVFDDIPQVLFGGGDGWLYSFRADRWEDGKPEFLWKFDGNSKDAVLVPARRSTRNSIVAPPIVCDGKVLLVMGEDPEHGEGPGNLWCIDPTKQGDVSPEIVVDQNGDLVPPWLLPAKGPLAGKGWKAVPNPDSAVVWHYDRHDLNGNGTIEFEEIMHRSVGSPVIKDDILVICDSSGLVHCLNAKTGKPYWTHDVLDACLSTPLMAGNKIYVADEAGDISIFPLSADPATASPPREINVGNAVHTMPVVANETLYIASQGRLLAISATDDQRPP